MHLKPLPVYTVGVAEFLGIVGSWSAWRFENGGRAILGDVVLVHPVLLLASGDGYVPAGQCGCPCLASRKPGTSTPACRLPQVSSLPTFIDYLGFFCVVVVSFVC